MVIFFNPANLKKIFIVIEDSVLILFASERAKNLRQTDEPLF